MQSNVALVTGDKCFWQLSYRNSKSYKIKCLYKFDMESLIWKRGRPRETWRRTIEREMKENGLGTWAAAASAAEDRTAWRQRAYSPIFHLENG